MSDEPKRLHVDGDEEWPADLGGRRVFFRWNPFRVVLYAGELELEPAVRDVSPNGIRVRWDGTPPVAVGDRIKVKIDDFGPVTAEVRRVRGDDVGLAFDFSAAEGTSFRQWLNLLRLAKEQLNIDGDDDLDD